jgi:adenosylcobinamide kinase/adenosylcobinamide-phosphate guanylyltransferase
MMAGTMTLILGGARSGKSTYAQKMVEADGRPALFVATATAGDEEMAARITAHRASRPSYWQTLEAPLDLGRQIASASPTPWVLVDCITLLTSNVLFACPEPTEEKLFRTKLEHEIEGLIQTARTHGGDWVLVSNEVGLGLVPPHALSRYYRDGLGWANQRIAQEADTVILMVAGLPLFVKGRR